MTTKIITQTAHEGKKNTQIEVTDENTWKMRKSHLGITAGKI
jgi:uncharacterized protein YggU (UPF0235/DUF167 family)